MQPPGRLPLSPPLVRVRGRVSANPNPNPHPKPHPHPNLVPVPIWMPAVVLGSTRPFSMRDMTARATWR